MGGPEDTWAEALRRDGRVEVDQHSGRSVRLLLACVLFVAVGAWIATTSDGVGRVVGWVAIVFFGLGAVVMAAQAWQARRGGPTGLVVDADGVRALRGGVDVPWSGIVGTHLFSHRGTRVVQLVLDEEFAERWYAGLSATNRALARASRGAAGGRPVASLPQTLDADPAALAAWLAAEATARRPV